jgi:hypothetical protein
MMPTSSPLCKTGKAPMRCRRKNLTAVASGVLGFTVITL